jgi:hypothetical protein
LDDGIGSGFENGHGNALAAVVVDLGHADLAAEKFEGHGMVSKLGSDLGSRLREGAEI